LKKHYVDCVSRIRARVDRINSGENRVDLINMFADDATIDYNVQVPDSALEYQLDRFGADAHTLQGDNE